MRSIRKRKRWIALILLATMAFAQASMALAGCELERRARAHFVAMNVAEGDCEMQSMGRGPLVTPRCLAHCTADLQISGSATGIARSPGDSSVLFVAARVPHARHRADFDPPPPGTIPIRILLHAFRI